MLKGFQTSHKEMSSQQTASLETFVKSIAKDVAAQLRDAAAKLKGVHADREKTSEELRASLAQAVKDIEGYTRKKLKEFDEIHTDMSDALKKSLAKYVGDIAGDVKTLLGSTRKLMGEYGSDNAKAKSAWLGMSASLGRSRKGGVMPRIEAGEKVATVTESVEKKSKKKAGKKGKKKSK